MNEIAQNVPIQSQVSFSGSAPATTAVKSMVKSHTALKAGLIITALTAIAANGIYQVMKSTKCTKQNNTVQKGIGCNYYYCQSNVPEDQRGSMGQDIYDPRDPWNNGDPESPFYQRKGAYGQDIYDKNDPYNKIDPASPYYDPNASA